MKILIIALSGIGDALMFTPALEILKKRFPEAEIDALVMFKGVDDIYSRLPEMHKIIYYNFLNSNPFKALKFVLSLRNKYDISINVYPSNRREYNIINLLIGADKRGAVKYLRKNFLNLGFLNNIIVRENDNLHNVEENINLVNKLTGKKENKLPPLRFPLTENDNQYSKKYLNEINITNSELVVGFHPGCSTLKNHIRRRWEPEKFAELGRRLIKQNNAKIFLFGGPDEKELKENILGQINSNDAFNIKTGNLAQTAALMKRCNLFVSNDSSLMHISAALGIKTVAIIGPTNVNYIHPWKTEHKIISLNLDCSPCFYYSPKPLKCYRNDVKFKCIKELTTGMVFNAVENLLKS